MRALNDAIMKIATHLSAHAPRQKAQRLLLCFLGLAGSMASSAFSSEPPVLERFEYRSTAMGSTLDIILYAPDRETAGLAISAALQTLDDSSQPINNYAPRSEISRLQKIQPNETAELSSEVSNCIHHSKRWFELSEGAFDATQSDLFLVWKQARSSQKLPTPSAIAQALNRSTWQDIQLLDDHGTSKIRHRGSRLSIDLGGLAVGYLIDRMMMTLRSAGIESAMIDAGGDIVVSSAPPIPPDQPVPSSVSVPSSDDPAAGAPRGWAIDIAGLDPKSPVVHRLYLENCSVTSSGDLNQYSIIDGKRYSHIVNPRTAQPVTQRRCVTVVAKKGIDADAGATSLAALGPQEAFRLLDRMPIDEVFYLTLDEESQLPIVQHWKR